jgi:acetyl-CoA carboxylase, biotin carboxylase subunit
MFHKVLIANRGEIAVRIIRACRDCGIIPVTVYSEPDRASLHVRLADEAYPIGPASALESYLDIEKVIDAARRSKADAIHPGYGFLSENPRFAEACAEADIAFIGPSAESMRMMGSKTSARALLRDLAMPLVPGTYAPLTSVAEAIKEARTLGYPVMVKASAGGGGKGMRLITDETRMESDFVAAGSEALRSFGDASLYLEKYMVKPRHIEIQILADRHGNVIHLGERECSIQRRHQKLFEESPSPMLDETLRRKMGEVAVQIVYAAHYEGAGTIEFLLDAERNFYFLEMNTRLQVEHPVTETVTGLDIVAEQFRIASGERLSRCQEQVQMRGCAMECRICAEDPVRMIPSAGRIHRLQEPQGPGIRLDSGIYQGWEVSIHYDPLLSKLIAFGADRSQAIARMRRALEEYRVTGLQTNLSFFLELLSNRDFLAGDTHTGLVEEVQRQPAKHADAEQSVLYSHALAAALAYAETTETPSGRETEAENPWKLSGRPGFTAVPRR